MGSVGTAKLVPRNLHVNLMVDWFQKFGDSFSCAPDDVTEQSLLGDTRITWAANPYPRSDVNICWSASISTYDYVPNACPYV